MSDNQTYRNRSIKVLGLAILVAAWMIAGPGVLNRLNLHGTVVELLVWVPAMIVFFWSISGHKKFIACERRAFKRLLNLR